MQKQTDQKQMNRKTMDTFIVHLTFINEQQIVFVDRTLENHVNQTFDEGKQNDSMFLFASTNKTYRTALSKDKRSSKTKSLWKRPSSTHIEHRNGTEIEETESIQRKSFRRWIWFQRNLRDEWPVVLHSTWPSESSKSNKTNRSSEVVRWLNRWKLTWSCNWRRKHRCPVEKDT